MNPARLIIDKQAGAMNMAIDEALLLSAPRTGPTLRLYEWEEPTLSLGYFQNAAERERHEASRGCPVVRRSTGGGAILHDQELTYSFVAPVEFLAPLVRDGKSASQLLYFAFHESLVQALGDLNMQASLCARALQLIGREPFLCFQRGTEGDVLLAGAKICGSAQRRQRLAVLQHGSVLLRRSPFAPELPGIFELAGKAISFQTLADHWLPRLVERLELNLQPGRLDDLEISDSNRLAEDRFGTDAWSLRR